MSVRIMTDSGSDIPQNTPDITVIPLTVSFGEITYFDGVDLDRDRFYELLASEPQLPTTSQVPPYTFEKNFKAAVEAGDTVVVITLSSKLSGTYQSACIAADEYEGKVFVVDSLNATVGERVLVEYALSLAKEGKDAEEVAKLCEEARDRVHLLGVVDTLDYLKKGGRVSAAVALAGNLLSIKPVLALNDGEIVMKGKARGSKQGNNLLNKEVEAFGGIDFTKPYGVAYGGSDRTLLDTYINDSAALWQANTQEIPISRMGAVIGTHVGPGGIAVAFFGKE